MTAVLKTASRFVRVAALSYTDRALAFVLPLLVISYLNRPAAYAEIEYIISLSVVIAGFADLGLRSYLLFAYRQNGQQVVDLAYGALYLLLLLQFLLIFAALGIYWLGGWHNALLGCLTACRVAALTLFGVVGQILILRDRPVMSASLSLACWLASALSLTVPPSVPDGLFLILFLLPSGVAAILALAWLGTRSGKRLGDSLAFLKRAFQWSWPLLISTALNLGVGNFAKIYAFAAMPQDDMVLIAFYQRLSMVLQISHAAIMVVLSKGIFTAPDDGIDRNVTFQYALSMGVTAFLLLGGLWMGYSFELVPVPWSFPIASLMAAYIFLWCFGAYFQIYVNRAGRNRMLLGASIASTLVFALLLVFVEAITPVLLAFSMALAAFVYAAFSFYLARLGAEPGA